MNKFTFLNSFFFSSRKQPYPKFTWVCSTFNQLTMFGFGSGWLRPGSGTWGTAFAWLLWFLFSPIGSSVVLRFFLVAAFIYGCWTAGKVSKELGVDDHTGIVWDEMVAFWLILSLTPDNWVAQTCAFGWFRLFDILKPFPIKFFERRVKGGFGIMFDDILAAAYAGIAMLITSHLGALSEA